MKLINQLQYLVEQTDKYFVIPTTASDELTNFISADEGVNGKPVLWSKGKATSPGVAWIWSTRLRSSKATKTAF